MELNRPIMSLPVCCEECKASKGAEFRKLLDLTRSGLLVYIHSNGKAETNKRENVIIHNVGDKTVKKSDFLIDLHRCKSKCYLCNTLTQRVSNLIHNITEIKENEMVAICDHCKRSTSSKCNRCDELIKRFLRSQINQYEDRQQALKIRLYEVRRILSLIVDRKNICDHKICQAYYDSNAELKILLELTKAPLPNKKTDIDEYFSILETQEKYERDGKDLFLKYQGAPYSSNESLSSVSHVESFCICKYLRNRNADSQSFLPAVKESLPHFSLNTAIDREKSQSNVLKEITVSDKDSIEKTPTKLKKVEKSPKTPKGKKNIGSQEDKENIPLGDGKSRTGKKRSSKQNKGSDMMMQLMKSQKKEKRQKEAAVKKAIVPKLPKILDLPEIEPPIKIMVDTETEISESVIECDRQQSAGKMIFGKEILPLRHHHKKAFHVNEPLFCKVKHAFASKEKLLTVSASASTSDHADKLKSKPHTSVDTMLPGIFKYELSNRKFIEKGWTVLPATRIVRKMNIYKMVPSYPQYDWFSHHDRQSPCRYSTGENLAEVDDCGGRWFYKNGKVAMEYYNSKDLKSGLKYVVYSSDDLERKKTPKILAKFDHFGNGIIYDDIGNVRLKYNQSEGMVFDKKLGPVGRWKWHTLNDPPVLHQIFIDALEEPDSCFQKLVSQEHADPKLPKKDSMMLAIELDNYVKDKASKMLQTYKPFELRMKAVKINDYFSVRIVNQANIRLLFRSGQMSMKVNMGMVLKSNEIVDTVTSDVSDVATPFDRPMSSSKSIHSI